MASRRARELKAAGREVINLTAGDPDFPTPEHVRAAAVAAMARGETHYTNPDGTPELKRAVQEKFERENGLSFSLEEIIIGAGGKPLIFNAFAATLAPGDEVIVPAPHWVSFPDMIALNDGVPRLVRCGEESGFKLTAEDLEAAITPRTRWVIINSPNNPSGAVYGPNELAALASVLLRHERVWILSDDVYEHVIFDGSSSATLARTAPELQSRILTVNSASKTYAMTGWRIGYAAGRRELIRHMASIQSQSASGPCSVSQAAALAALVGPQDIVSARRAELRERRDLVVPALNRVPGMSCHVPAGSIYAFPSCSGLLGRYAPDGTRIGSDTDLALYLLEAANVAVVPGEAYGFSPYLRLDLGVSRELLSAACARIARACAALVTNGHLCGG